MATATLQHPEQELSVTKATVDVAKPLLVATDATTGSDAALRAARAIAGRTGAAVRMIAVYASVPAVAAEMATFVPRSYQDQEKSLEIGIEDQLGRVGIQSSWPVDIVQGDPAATIAATAEQIGAELIILGLGGHDLFDRIFGDEMALKVLRLGRTPVLCVAPAFHALPRHALAAVDFSESCKRALAVGAPLVARTGRLTLAHVMPTERDSGIWNTLDAAYVGSVGRAFDRVIADTEVEVGVRFERHVVAGDPGERLLKLSAETAPDLIIAGSHGHNFLTRLMIGSVSTRLLRDSRRSILIAPPMDGPGYLDELPDANSRFGFYEWAERLEEFSRRNTGRIAVLEVIEPKIGAQIEEKGVKFAGASFDPRDGRVHIMCACGGTGHLTRSISGVTGIQVLRDRNGDDAFLRVAHGRGQTLLTLER